VTKAKTRSRALSRVPPGHTKSAEDASAHYHREKARRARRLQPENELMAAARREYLALLEMEAAKGKGGRPKKKAAKPADAELLPDDDRATDE
jgi:hypothetical protein